MEKLQRMNTTPEPRFYMPSVKSWPQHVKNLVVDIETEFEGFKTTEQHDLPPEPISETYKFIEGTAKKFAEEYCKERLEANELTLNSGECNISCDDKRCRLKIEESQANYRLESPDDWKEIATIVGNYENTHQHILKIIITRKLRLVKTPVVLPAQESTTRKWLYLQLNNAQKKNSH